VGGKSLKGDRDVLVIFNLETNLDSQVLAMGHSWVEKLAANDFQKVFVYSTHVGRHHLPTKVTVVEIGGGNFFKRLERFVHDDAVMLYILSR
jgi:hypothetical protein